MKYVGSKRRVAKEITEIINQTIQQNCIKTYIEPFVGGSNVIDKVVCDRKIGCDNNKYLIAFWRKIQQGWNPLDEVEMTKELYTEIRLNHDKYPLELVALAGFCATYRAKWFGGYAGITHTKEGTIRDYYTESVKNVLKQSIYIKDIVYIYKDYKNINTKNSLIYCDPPYEGKIGYKDKFDHKQYWQWVRQISKHNIVLCSEYKAPKDFEVIWSKHIESSIDWKNREMVTEKLFRYKGGK